MKSEEEMIEIVRNNGFQIKYVPMVVVPTYYNTVTNPRVTSTYRLEDLDTFYRNNLRKFE